MSSLFSPESVSAPLCSGLEAEQKKHHGVYREVETAKNGRKVFKGYCRDCGCSLGEVHREEIPRFRRIIYRT